jgi:hypothetical protein
MARRYRPVLGGTLSVAAVRLAEPHTATVAQTEQPATDGTVGD